MIYFHLIQGHNNKHEYIATQHPLQDTMGSFWKMIHQEKVKAIVMLNKLKEGGLVSFLISFPPNGI